MTAALVVANSALSAGSSASAKACGTSCWKKLMMSGNLLDGDFGEDARRVLEIGVRRGEQCGHLFFAGDERAQAVVGRSKFALHQDECRVGAGARVGVGVLLPRADGFECEQLRADVVEHNFAVGARNKIGRELSGSMASMCCSKLFSAAISASMAGREKSSSCASYWWKPRFPSMGRSGSTPGRSIRR